MNKFCCYCKRENSLVLHKKQIKGLGLRYYIQCSTCHSMGDICITAEEAIEQWNAHGKITYSNLEGAVT